MKWLSDLITSSINTLSQILNGNLTAFDFILLVDYTIIKPYFAPFWNSYISTYTQSISEQFSSYSIDYLVNYILFQSIDYTTLVVITFSIKFILLIALLVFVRGGIPRYRYDFLTKIGWFKLLSLTLSFFLTSFLLIHILL